MLWRLFFGGLLVLGAASAHAARVPPTPAPELPSDYKDLAQNVLALNLREPGSGAYEFRDAPYQMSCGKDVFQTPSPVTIWMVDVFVNGKNGYGGFTGFQAMSVAFYEKNGQLIHQSYLKPGGGAITRFGLCKRVSQ